MSTENKSAPHPDKPTGEEERRQQQSIQDQQNQSREDQQRPHQTHRTHNQSDKQIAPEQRSQDSK